MSLTPSFHRVPQSEGCRRCACTTLVETETGLRCAACGAEVPPASKRLQPVLREACRMWNDYRDHWSDMAGPGKAYRLPDTLIAAFERLGAAIAAAEVTVADVEG